MTETQAVLERPSVRILEGTPAELTAYLATVPQDREFGLILPEQIKASPTEKTLAEILAPAQQGFEGRDLTEEELEELDDFIEAEVKAYRAEKRDQAQAAA